MGNIKELIQNTKTGTILVVTNRDNRQRSLGKDRISYFVTVNKKTNLVDRFTQPDDIQRIKNFLR